MQEIHTGLKDRGVGVLGVLKFSRRNSNDVLAKLNEHKGGYPNIIPKGQGLMEYLKTIKTVPAVVFVNSSGEVLGKFEEEIDIMEEINKALEKENASNEPEASYNKYIFFLAAAVALLLCGGPLYILKKKGSVK